MPRPALVCDCGGHAWLPLTRGFVALIDPEYREAVGRWSWHVHTTRTTAHARRPYHQWDNGRRRTISIFMHHVVLPTAGAYIVDHINGNGLDNRSSNLRLATPAENSSNKRTYGNTTSKYRGVRKQCGKWSSRIVAGGQQFHLGNFETEAEAARAYDEAAAQKHGGFARLNFPNLSQESGR